jgi:hypothetical protein
MNTIFVNVISMSRVLGVLTSSLFATVILGGICIVPLLMFSSRCFSHIVEVKCGSDGFIIKMRDGKHVRCVHNTPQGGHLLDYVPHPAIVLKMEDGTGLLLPIIVLEMPSVLLMAAIRNVPIARPTMYQIVKEMIDKMGYAVKFVRVTKRVHEAYFAQLCLTKVYSH